MSKNRNLNQSQKDRRDEFYTRYEDIKKELIHYREHFIGKTVYCNCDSPYESQFVRYFISNFNDLVLKKLIVTNFRNEFFMKAYKAVITKVSSTSDIFSVEGNFISELEGKGDFRSEECLELLKESDIVVTNPPFSLFRDFVRELMEYNKEFLIIGNMNALTYKEIFPYVKENKIWLGVTKPKKFIVPELTDSRKNVVEKDGERLASFGNILWFTNLENYKRHETLILTERYTPEVYPKYDNYDAIEVSKVKDIPIYYSGVMGVPITFLDRYNPEQFEILGSRRWAKSEELLRLHSSGDREKALSDKKVLIDGREVYDRIFVKYKEMT